MAAGIHIEFSKKHFRNLAMVSLLITGAICMSISVITITNISSPFKDYQCSTSSTKATNMETQEEDELETVLKKTSLPNKTLIITIVNKAYVEGDKSMLDLFLDSFWLGEGTQELVDHVLVVSMDQTAYDRCKFLKLNCYKLVTDGVDYGGEKLYMSLDFINMMWSRTRFLSDVLKRGYSFVFTDTDVMWLRNPFLRLDRNETVDFQISCDKFNGNQWSKTNPINTGFYFVRSNNKTVSLFETWYTVRNNYTGMKEQDVLINLIHTGVVADLGIKVKYLNTMYFSGFCQNSKRFGVVTTVHANCCRTINAKVADLTAVLSVWKKLKSLIVKWRRSKGSIHTVLMPKWSQHSACFGSWEGFKF